MGAIPEPTITHDVARDLEIIDALIDHTEGEDIWAVLDHARTHGTSIRSACEHVLGGLPDVVPGG